MRTYSHALLTWAAVRTTARRAGSTERVPAAWGALGATIPDLPAGLGAAWLWTRRRAYSRAEFEADVCARDLFRRPDAALHSAVPLTVALVLYALSGARDRAEGRAVAALLIGWAGHVATDALTHGTDARPTLWPLSKRRFESPVSYRERDRYALPFTLIEHAATLAAVLRLLRAR
jgi:hypothetical protein